jgi:hypothetical protein
MAAINFKDFESVPDAWKDAVWNELRKQNNGKEVAGVCDTDETPKQKRRAANAPLQEGASPRFDNPVVIRVHQFRHRLCDHSNVYTKDVEDALVKGSIIKDDGPDYVKQVISEQTKIGKEEMEYTLITITEI